MGSPGNNVATVAAHALQEVFFAILDLLIRGRGRASRNRDEKDKGARTSEWWTVVPQTYRFPYIDV